MQNEAVDNGMRSVRCLELYCGIGGFAVAASQRGWSVAKAIDINQYAAAVYRCNFDHPHEIRTIESIPDSDLKRVNADIWWMSPPCQPYTQRGAKRDLNDSRMESFLHLLDVIPDVRPPMLAMENVPQFSTSRAADRLRSVLETCDYRWIEFDLCPTELGIPNRRRRFYLTAALDHNTLSRPESVRQTRQLSGYLEPMREELLVGETQKRYAEGFHCVTQDSSTTACFTSAYGKSPVHAGSYLQDESQLRHFSPREILSLLGFPTRFQMPANLSLRTQWKLVGNSLSIPAVAHVLRAFGER